MSEPRDGLRADARPSRFGLMVVVDTDQGAGRLYLCPCRKMVWSAWGHALRHAQTCPKSGLSAHQDNE